MDHISGVVSWDTKRHFSEIMIEFRQPIQIQPNRYESRTERTDALEVAIDRLRDYDIGLVVDLGQFTRNYTQTTKRGLLTTNKG